MSVPKKKEGGGEGCLFGSWSPVSLTTRSLTLSKGEAAFSTQLCPEAVLSGEKTPLLFGGMSPLIALTDGRTDGRVAEETSREREGGETLPSHAPSISRCDFINYSRAFCILPPAKQMHRRYSMLTDLEFIYPWVNVIHLAEISQVTKRGKIRTSSRGGEGAASLAPLVARPFYEQKNLYPADPTNFLFAI